jgi:hypothetical protein
MNRYFAIAIASVLALSILATTAAAGDSGKRGQGVKSGHYTGQSNAGLPVSFDVVRNGSRAKIENLAVDVDTECWNDADHDGVSDRLVAHITGLKGSVSRSGEVDVYYAPDDDTEYVVEGTIKGGDARLLVTAGGSWDTAGNPSPAGPLQCDNWGTRYKAGKNRR